MTSCGSPVCDARGRSCRNDFKKSIYASDDVKDMLWREQHRKCCFCEHKYERKFATIEHFRPKTRARNTSGKRNWGYWWLGYAIENLYFCCSNCNTPKNEWFPLEGRARRYRPKELPWTSSYREPAMILDPGRGDDPEKHIVFLPHPSHGQWRIASRTDRGSVTIDKIALDRDDLDELRDDHYDNFLTMVLRHRDNHGPAAARPIAAQFAGPRVPFSLLARCVFRKEGLY